MSGPVTTADVDPDGESPPPERGIEVFQNRRAVVGAMPVQRALPQRVRRTVGAWCFLDIGGPVDRADSGPGIGPHPHIGLQTVTWPFEGELLHRDSLGSEQLIRPGELNLMTAGHGIVHAEEHVSSGRYHLAQLWVALPDGTRDGPAAFEHHADLPQIELEGGTATVLVGALGDAVSPARRDTDHVGADLVLRADTVLPVDPTHEHAVVPIEGIVQLEGTEVRFGQCLYAGPGRRELVLRVVDGARVMVLGGVPFGERVTMWWNYVARTHEEISRAHDDWTNRRERFVIPRSTLETIDTGPPPWTA